MLTTGWMLVSSETSPSSKSLNRELVNRGSDYSGPLFLMRGHRESPLDSHLKGLLYYLVLRQRRVLRGVETAVIGHAGEGVTGIVVI